MRPWGTIYGIGVFRDPATAKEYLLIAADGSVFFSSPGNSAQALPLPGATTITTNCRFVQCFDVVLLLRGPDAPVLRMTSIFSGFTDVPQTDAGDGTLTIPNSSFGLAAQNRLFLIQDDDIVASDLFDYTRYSIFDELRINEGSEDRLVAIGLFGKSTIVALKDLSVYRVDNVFGDLSLTSLSRVTERYGCVAARSAVDMGTDFVWLAHEGIASLVQTQLNEIQAAQGALSGRWPMFSDDIKPLISRINWQYASGAVAAFNDGKLYMAVPLDDAERLGPELVSRSPYIAGSIIVTGLTPGRSYRWTMGSTDDSLTNGTDVFTYSTDFVAQTGQVTIAGHDQLTIGTLTALFRGVNNAVLVYDTQSGPNGAWAGHDESAEIAVKDFFQANYLGKRRLFFIDYDGWVKLYEEDFEDQKAQPYVDVRVASLPAIGDTIRVNGGVTVTAVNSTSNSPAGNWGCDNLGDAVVDLWSDFAGRGGYGPAASNPWSAPNTAAAAISAFNALIDGVRFYATNGSLPRVEVTGSWAEITQAGSTQIISSLTTRGYGSPELAEQHFRWLTLDLQTWHPSLTFDLLTEGVSETLEVSRNGQTTLTKSRTKFDRPFDRAAYDPTNLNGDFADPYRQDYSIQPTSATYDFSPSSGVRGDLHQDQHETFPIRAEGRAPQLVITCSQGRMRLLTVKLKSTLSPEHAGTK